MSEAALDFRSRVGALARSWSGTDRALPPRDAIQALGSAGLIRERWSGADASLGVAMIDELGGHNVFSKAVCVGLHVEAVLSMLRTSTSSVLAPIVEGALDGRLIGCIAASEARGGSDLAGVQATAERTGDGWHVVGAKKFVTLATTADFTVVLARIVPGRPGHLGAFVVPRSGFEVTTTHELIGAHELETSAIRLDARVPDEHLLGRPGAGLAVLTRGLTHERLAVAALIASTCRFAIGLTVTRAHDRVQFGRPLIEHQAIRFRLADLQARLRPLESHVQILAASSPPPTREVAALKVTAARFGEECLRECAHLFGGDGYLVGPSPLSELSRDIRLGRIGGGTDELMWEIVAGGLRPDWDTYRRHCRVDDADEMPAAAPRHEIAAPTTDADVSDASARIPSPTTR